MAIRVEVFNLPVHQKNIRFYKRFYIPCSMSKFLQMLAHFVLTEMITIFFVSIDHQGTNVQRYKETM